MEYRFNFGKIGSKPAADVNGKKFRLAVLGDFSGRANRGVLETGDALADRKPHKVDVDNLDDFIERLGLTLNLPLDGEGGSVEVSISSIDDLHPDELYDNVEIFSELSVLRQRLKNNKTFAAAAAEVQGWHDADAAPKKRSRKRSKATDLAVDARLSDFARLMGEAAPPAESAPVEDLIKSVVAPFVVPAKDPKQDEMIAAVDKALSGAMSSLLHHPDFQATESMLRTVELLVRSIETGPSLQIVVYDVSAEEIAADISQTDNLEETGLYRMLVEAPGMDAQQGALSVVLGLYTFDHTPPHAELLGRIAQIAAAAKAPFLAGIRKDILLKDADEPHHLIQEAWDALKAMPAAKYLGLCAPRFMLRYPYGKKTEPVDPFAYEEFNIQEGLGALLWANAALLPALLLALTFSEQGEKMKPGKIMSIGEQPFCYHTDAHGDQIALPCTERMLTTKAAQEAILRRVMPILAIKGRPEIRLATWQSVGNGMLGGFWNPVDGLSGNAASAAAPADEEDDVAADEPEDTDVDTDSGDDDLDALLGDLDSGSDDSSDDGGDDDLDALLSDLGGDDDSGDSGDDDLDALLAGLGGDDDDSGGDDDEMDPDLAALLADL